MLKMIVSLVVLLCVQTQKLYENKDISIVTFWGHMLSALCSSHDRIKWFPIEYHIPMFYGEHMVTPGTTSQSKVQAVSRWLSAAVR